MPTRLRTFAIVLPVTVALGGCSTATVTKFPQVSLDTTTLTLDTAIRKADELRTKYRTNIEDTRAMQLWFDVPLIGLAAGTLASVVFKGSRDLSIGLGLGAGAVGAGRTYVNPSDRIAALNKGMKAATCVHSSLVALPKDDALTEDVAAPNSSPPLNTSAKLVTARALLGAQLPNGADADSARVFGAAQDRLTAALAKGESAQALAKLADKLLKNAPKTAGATLIEIETQVDNLIINGTQDLNSALARIEAGVISARDLIGRRNELRGSTSGQVAAANIVDASNNARTVAKVMSDLAVDLETISERLTAASTDIETKNSNLIKCGVI